MATLNTTEVATEFGTDARTLRKFLRSPQGTDSTVGKGARWSIEKRDLRSLRKRFETWSAAQEARKVQAAEAALDTDEVQAAEAPVEVEEIIETDFDSLDAPETDEELEALIDA